MAGPGTKQVSRNQPVAAAADLILRGQGVNWPQKRDAWLPARPFSYRGTARGVRAGFRAPRRTRYSCSMAHHHPYSSTVRSLHSMADSAREPTTGGISGGQITADMASGVSTVRAVTSTPDGTDRTDRRTGLRRPRRCLHCADSTAVAAAPAGRRGHARQHDWVSAVCSTAMPWAAKIWCKTTIFLSASSRNQRRNRLFACRLRSARRLVGHRCSIRSKPGELAEYRADQSNSPWGFKRT